MKNPNDTIGNRTHDLPACSAVHQRNRRTTQIHSFKLAAITYNVPRTATIPKVAVYLFHNSTLEICSKCIILRLYPAHLGGGVGTDPPDAKIALPVFEVCAFYEQFGEHSLSDCVVTSAVFFSVAAVRHPPWHLR